MPGGVRLQKVLAAAGMGSRRACEEMIGEGRIEVDGEIVRRFGARVDPERQIIRVDGRRIAASEKLVYVALNKPPGVTDHDVGHPGPQDHRRPARATGPSGCSTSGGSTTRPRA